MHRIDSRIDEIRAANSLQGAAVSQPPLALKKAPLLELTIDEMQNSLRSLRRTFLDTWPQTAALSPGLFFVFVQLCLDGGFDLFVQGAVVLEDFLCRVAPLSQLGAFVIQPGTALLDDLFFQCKIEESASGGNSLVIHDIELGFGERRSNFVFHDFDARPISRYNAVGLFDGADAADIDSHAGVKLQRPAAGSRLRVSKHDSDLFPNLVCENAACSRFGNDRREFAQRSTHQSRLRTDCRIANFTFQLCSGDQRCHRINDNYVEGIGAHQRLANPKRFLSRARLRDEQIIKIDTESLCVGRIERVLDIDKRRQATAFLCLRDHSKSERCLPRRLRTKHFDDSAAWESAHSERPIDQDVARWNNVDIDDLFVTETHDRAFAVIFC